MLGSKEPQKKEKDKPPHRGWNATEPFFDFRASHWAQSILALALLAVAGVQARIYSQQANIMTIGQRSYVGLKEQIIIPKTYNIPNYKTALLIFATWINSGHTPTAGLVIRGGCDLSPSFNTGTPEAPKSFDTKQWVLFPGTDISYITCMLKVRDIRNIFKPGIPFYIYGQADYEDPVSLGKKLHTRFCVRVTGIAGDPESADLSAAIIKPCDEESTNCTDDECKNTTWITAP